MSFRLGVTVIEEGVERIETAVLRLVRLQMVFLADVLQFFIKLLLFWVNIFFAAETLFTE